MSLLALDTKFAIHKLNIHRYIEFFSKSSWLRLFAPFLVVLIEDSWRPEILRLRVPHCYHKAGAELQSLCACKTKMGNLKSMPSITFSRRLGSVTWERETWSCSPSDLRSTDEILVSPTSPGTCLLNELGKRNFNIRKASFRLDGDHAADRVIVEYAPDDDSARHTSPVYVYIAQIPTTTLDKTCVVTQTDHWALVRRTVHEADVLTAIAQQPMQWNKNNQDNMLLYYDPNVRFIKHLDLAIACREHSSVTSKSTSGPKL